MDELSQDSQVPSCLCSMEGTQGSSHVPKAGIACSQESYWEPMVVRSPPWLGVEWVISPDLGWELQVEWSHERAPKARPSAPFLWQGHHLDAQKAHMVGYLSPAHQDQHGFLVEEASAGTGQGQETCPLLVGT